jgi:hypothetical protein
VTHLHGCDVESSERLFSTTGCGLDYSPDSLWLAVRDPDENAIVLLDADTHERPRHPLATSS